MAESKSAALTSLATPQVCVQSTQFVAAGAAPAPAPRTRASPRATAACSARASASVSNSAKTHAPDPVMRACGRCFLSHARLAATSGYRATTAASRSFAPCPDKKGGILSRFVERVNADSKISFVETETCGVSTRYQAGGRSSARQPLADPFANGVAAVDEDRHVGAELRPPGRAARCLRSSRSQSWFSTSSTVAASDEPPPSPPPIGRFFSSARSQPLREPVSALSSRAARTQRFSSPKGPSKAILPSSRGAMPTRSQRSISRKTVCSSW